MRMRVMLLGADNRLGQALTALAEAENIQLMTVGQPEGGWRAEALDGWLAQQPDAVVNLTHYHEQFQLGVQDARTLQAQRAFDTALLAACQQRDVLLLMLSSARVFDGLKPAPYSEKDETAPADPLGAMQVELEQRLLAWERHLILRLSWVLDSSAEGQLGRLLAQLCSAQPVTLAEEWRGNPTPVTDVARVILALLKQVDCDAPLYGIYHYGGAEVSSWISLAKALVQELLAAGYIEHDPLIQPVPFSSQPMAGKEPQNAALSGKRILHTFGIKPRAWRSQLAGLLEQSLGAKNQRPQ